MGGHMRHPTGFAPRRTPRGYSNASAVDGMGRRRMYAIASAANIDSVPAGRGRLYMKRACWRCAPRLWLLACTFFISAAVLVFLEFLYPRQKRLAARSFAGHRVLSGSRVWNTRARAAIPHPPHMFFHG